MQLTTITAILAAAAMVLAHETAPTNSTSISSVGQGTAPACGTCNSCDTPKTTTTCNTPKTTTTCDSPRTTTTCDTPKTTTTCDTPKTTTTCDTCKTPGVQDKPACTCDTCKTPGVQDKPAPTCDACNPDSNDPVPAPTCGTCNPVAGQNKCHITTSCIDTGSSFHCACRAGYKASQDNNNILSQFRLNMTDHEFLVFVPENTACDTLCDDPFTTPSDKCSEVTMWNSCPA